MTRISEAHVARLGYTGRVVVRHASSSEIRAGLRALLARGWPSGQGAADTVISQSRERREDRQAVAPHFRTEGAR